MIQDTRHALVEAAIIVFNEDFSAALEKVAERAGTTRRTLHRYFRDRKELMIECEAEMQKACRIANESAYQLSEEPIERLENMFNAGLECGVKSAFLRKLHHQYGHEHKTHSKTCKEYDQTTSLWRIHMVSLREKGLINKELSMCWIDSFFYSIVEATTNMNGGDDKQKLHQLAWYSFSKGIGL
ncbi:TetR/AcrR family transcriptional regulator [Dyadobacter luteus]|uniref:TetR/AcrR family transcriptional regulator n=1 Tax=Dyadobacter luteus TaxID=2259619 RepID=A0A3D8Y8T6_9BACT|nr:TetR/AcrR family transcriptional regulator [Dyadobacter luteus]REA59744.1 TetR/AcrR family transcriptional regulator [Dyadobacter luteus]